MFVLCVYAPVTMAAAAAAAITESINAAACVYAPAT